MKNFSMTWDMILKVMTMTLSGESYVKSCVSYTLLSGMAINSMAYKSMSLFYTTAAQHLEFHDWNDVKFSKNSKKLATSIST